MAGTLNSASARRSRNRLGGQRSDAGKAFGGAFFCRRYVLCGLLPDAQATGWLAAARDHHVGKALALMHSRIAQPWTIASLANEVGLSRTALVDRFTALLAMPPIVDCQRAGACNSPPAPWLRPHTATLKLLPMSATSLKRRSVEPSNAQWDCHPRAFDARPGKIRWHQS